MNLNAFPGISVIIADNTYQLPSGFLISWHNVLIVCNWPVVQFKIIPRADLGSLTAIVAVYVPTVCLPDKFHAFSRQLLYFPVENYCTGFQCSVLKHDISLYFGVLTVFFVLSANTTWPGPWSGSRNHLVADCVFLIFVLTLRTEIMCHVGGSRKESLKTF